MKQSEARKEIPLIRPAVGEEELEQVREVLESGWLAQGKKVKRLEDELGTYLGAKYVVATSSCTTALSLAIDALDLEGTEVLVPDFTFPATGNVVVRAGGRPVLVDVERDTYGVSPSQSARLSTKKTKAMMPVHPFGHPFEMDELYELAEKRGLDVIEDAATAIGTRYKGRLVGASGRAVAFSFHPRKLLTTAEGGCLVTDDQEVYEKARVMRSHGQVTAKDGKIKFIYNGLNYRMSDVHAAIGLAQLRKVDRLIASRRKQAKIYGELLGDKGLDVTLPVETKDAFHTYQSYVLVLGRSLRPNTEVSKLLKTKHGVESQVGTYALSVQPSFARYLKAGAKPATSRVLYERSLTLPLYEGLSEDDQAYIADSLASASRL